MIDEIQKIENNIKILNDRIHTGIQIYTEELEKIKAGKESLMLAERYFKKLDSLEKELTMLESAKGALKTCL